MMVIGKGSEKAVLTREEIEGIIAEGIPPGLVEGKRVLVLTPDGTRTAPLPVMTRIIDRVIGAHARRLDFMVALGTHKPLSREEIKDLYGVGEDAELFQRSHFYNHRWDLPKTFVKIGAIEKAEVDKITGGLLSELIEIQINRAIFEYDLILILGPVFPHEVVGFSGGNKYFFPGISGGEFLHLFHWLGALITSEKIIGREDTLTRRIIDRASSLIGIKKLCISMVVRSEEDVAGLYVGSPEESWRAAAGLSSRVHVVYKDRTFSRVLGVVPARYNELWVAGKVMYKLEPVVADGGELIIYGPHVDRISHTWGSLLEQTGYHVRDYFLSQMERFRDIPKAVLAHSTHVKGSGSYRDGKERPRIRVALATAIPEKQCRKLDLGYIDPAAVDLSSWRNKEEEGALIVDNAGETLYRLKEQ